MKDEQTSIPGFTNGLPGEVQKEKMKKARKGAMVLEKNYAPTL